MKKKLIRTSTKSKVGPSETHARSLVKTLTYRVVIIISIFSVTYIITGSLDDSLSITGTTAITGTILYYLHERIWADIKWGRR